MSTQSFPLGEKHEFITLDKLLKITRLVSSGGEAHMVIQEGMVEVNGVIEMQKRKKLRQGDTASFNGISIRIE